MLYQLRSTIVSSRHYLHITSPRAQENLKDRIVEEPSKLPPNRAKRLREATSSIENLYLRSTAHDNSGSGHSKTDYRSVSLEGSSRDQPSLLASRHIGGVPLSKDAIEGTRRAPSLDGGRFTMAPGRRQPFPRAEISAGREVIQPAVDARSLGARPEGAQGPFLMRRVPRDAPWGPPERSIFQSRDLQGDSGAQSHRFEDTNSVQPRSPREELGIQQRPPREGSARYAGTQGAEKAGQAFQTRFTRDQSNFKARSPRREGPPQQSGRSRGGRSQASRDSGNSDPRRRKRGVEGNYDKGDRRSRDQEKWTEEEQQYLKEKAERKSQKSLEYEPVECSRETFTGMGPATASDEWGMSEMLGERLLLARKYLDREFIQWDSKEQKADVMAVVEKLKAVKEDGKSNAEKEKAKEASSTSGNGDQQAHALMQKLFAGEYAKFKRLGKYDVLGNVEMYVHRNDSFYPDDEKSLLEKVRSILPAEQASKVGRGARKEVKA